MSLRPVSNLVVPAHLKLDKEQLKQGFMYVYGKAYSGPEPVFITRLWLSSFMPELAQDPTFGKNRKGMRDWAKYQALNLRAGYLKIRKINDVNDPHFVVTVPLAEFSRQSAQETFERYRQWFTTGKGEMPSDESAKALHDHLTTDPKEDLESRVIPGAQALSNMHWIDAKGKAALQQTLLNLRLQYVGSLALVTADFRVSKEEAQQLSCNEWLTIRNIDLYPLLLQWVAGQFGYTTSAPLAAFPISKVAQTLPPTSPENVRVNDDGLSIDPKGIPMWLPHKLNQTTKYESLYSQVGDIGDDAFQLLDLTTVDAQLRSGVDEIKINLPANIPVLIDWVNNKYAYTQSTGMLKIQDLSRFKKADVGHIHNLLDTTLLTTPTLATMVAMAKYAGADMTLRYTAEELKAIAVDDAIAAQHLSNGLDIKEAWDVITEFYETYIGGPTLFKFISAEGDPIMRALGRWVEAARSTVLANLEAVNTHFAVATVSAVLGRMTLLMYANQHTDIVTRNNTMNAAALNQAVDPNWTPPSLPLGPRVKFLPHQQKVRNLLKDSPDFAILPVQAGGGKSVLSITDVLYEIKANKNQPYLILCPNHLVAQYVKEIVFFTAGQLNVVPVNNFVMRHNGFERMTKMLENAPRNTVVVADYDTLRARPTEICYGTTSVTVYPVIEFLRQFNFGYAMLDESHYVKNDSQRTRACMVLIADIPKKRLASGTMAHDSPSDLAIQIGLLDPTLFGSREKFNDTYGAEVKGNRVVEWNPGAQQEIMTKIKTRVVVAKAMRKEWAALLPHAEEQFHGVHLTPAQQDVYTAILTEALEHIKKDAKSNSALARFFKGEGEQVDEEVEDGDEQNPAEAAADESEGGDLEALLGFYLARLEQFISAPVADPLGDKMLKGDDRISPKQRKIIECMRTHIDNKYPGKVLVFTNYTASAEAIYNGLPADLKAKALLYVAADKVSTGHLFENDPNKVIMIGVENSMNTGLNLQFVSRLIRVETVWNPGTLEQGNSRVNRPELKKNDARGSIYYDWIIANRTIDITKISRLISKIIAVGKFENAEDPNYTAIADVKVIPMNEDSILTMNDWNDNLLKYSQAYKQYKQVMVADYAAYRKKHGDIKLEDIKHAPIPKDAKLMAEVPYVPGLELHGTETLGLVRADEFLRQELRAGDDAPDSGEDEADGDAAEMQRRADLNAAIAGQSVHTEFGDGIARSIRHKTKSINVLLNSGYSVLLNMAAVFVVTKANVSGEALRSQLLETVGVEGSPLPVQAPTGMPGARFKIDSVAQRKLAREKLAQEKGQDAAERQEGMSVELEINISNGFLGITYYVDEDRPDVNNALQALGFQPNPPFVLAEVKTHVQLKKQFDIWQEAGFTFDKFSVKNNVHMAFHDMWTMLKNKAVIQHREMYTFGTRNNLVNFFRQESRPSISKTEFKPYPMIEDGKTFIVMHTRGQPASLLAMKKRAPGIRWQHGADSMLYYGLDAAHTVAKLKQIIAAGIQIANIADLRDHVKKLKRVKVRNADSDSTDLI